MTSTGQHNAGSPMLNKPQLQSFSSLVSNNGVLDGVGRVLNNAATPSRQAGRGTVDRGAFSSTARNPGSQVPSTNVRTLSQ
jgi:hypothetical protein